MLTLRLTQHVETQDHHYRIETALEGQGLYRQTAQARFEFALGTQDHKDLRWYLEDYLQHPFVPERQIAARIVHRMTEIGVELFRGLFQGNEDTRGLWEFLRPRLNETRIEVITDVAGATAIPWELLRDPRTDTPLALRARAFVRAHPQGARSWGPPQAEAGPVRILLVISRPGGRHDVPFRSVAMRIVKGLDKHAAQAFRLDVLRPPTFERLSEVLDQAKHTQRPYHVVHFDGHGAFLDLAMLFLEWRDRSKDDLVRALAEMALIDRHRFLLEAVYPHTPRPGLRGYLAFERTQSDNNLNLRLVDGTELGKLLAESNVPLLVLNACRSAYAEAPSSPPLVGQEPAEEWDIHSQVRAYGSLAHQVMDAGAVGVVAMRYNVYVVTAAQFVADLYAALAQGQTLGEAATLGRRQLSADPLRSIAYDPCPLQDWPLPVIYEAGPIRLFFHERNERLAIQLPASGATAALGTRDSALPPPPDVGFYGRDESLLALDRAFDTEPIVLLHAYAGSGKTATAAEFARWYALTGGVDGPVLFTSFEQYKPLARVLDQIEREFQQALEERDIDWVALDDDARRAVALQVLRQAPVLWIWDNIEPVAGFPAGSRSAWSEAEQRELADFLRQARGTKAKFLLTSRRDERAWLGDLPRRIELRPMPRQERVQLARSVAERHGHRLADVEDWEPLLHYTQGNPMAITVVVRQALRDGLTTKEAIEGLVTDLRSGEAQLKDDVTEGRMKSLAASLNYGFQHAFDENERRILALLHLFQGFVWIDALRAMGDPAIGNLRDLCGLTQDYEVALLNRAAEVGLLTEHVSGLAWSIHPAVPWFFKGLFEQFYGGSLTTHLGESSGERSRAIGAYVEAMGSLGDRYLNDYQDGNRDIIKLVTLDEANLLHAWRLARRHGWWSATIGTMQGLRALYQHTSRRTEWKQLVEDVVPDLVDPTTDGPLPGLEKDWSVVTGYRVMVAEAERRWDEAERLLHRCIAEDRRYAAPSLAAIESSGSPDALDDAQRSTIQRLISALEGLGRIQQKQGKPECATALKEAIALSYRSGDRPSEAVAAFQLGHVYKNLPSLRDLKQAELWYRRSLDRRDDRDRLGRSKCYTQLGAVAWELFREAQEAGRPDEQLLDHCNKALDLYFKALELTPPDAPHSLAVKHNAIGLLYGEAGHVDSALVHLRKSVRYFEEATDFHSAAVGRFNIAQNLYAADRLDDAQAYAKAALQGFQTCSASSSEIQSTQRLLAYIDQAIRKPG